MKQGIRTYAYYTIFFLILVTAAFFPFFAEGRSLLWSPDAVVYHIPMAEVFAETIKRFCVSGTFTGYDLSIGMGTDVLLYISQWYMEPLNLLYAFFGAKKAEIIYSILIIVRLYLVGIGFLVFTGLFEKKSMPRVMGALVYVFSGYTLFTGTKAAPFLVAMILLPLILYATERIRRGKSFALFVLLIAFSAVFSYYFLFMNSVLLALYVLIAVFAERMEIRAGIKYIAKLIGYYFVGLAIGAVTFLPSVAGFLGSSRSSGARNVDSFLYYDAEYYEYLFTGFLWPDKAYDYWLVIGFSPLVLVAVVVLFGIKDKVALRIKIAWIAALAGVCVPLFGCLMNGGKVANNRWLYAMIMIGAVTVCKTYPVLMSGIERFFGGRGKWAVRCAAVIWCGGLVLTMAIGGYSLFAESGAGFVQEFHKSGRAYKIMTDNTNIAVKKIKDDSLFRVDNARTEKRASSAWVAKEYRGLVTNASGYSKEMADFYRYFENAGVITSFRLNGMDNSTVLTTLAGVKYYTANKGQEKRIPYGYEHVKGKVYQNKYAVPFSYSYDTFAAKSDTADMSPVQKQELLLQAVIVDDETAELLAAETGLKKTGISSFESCELAYEIINTEDIVISKDGTEMQMQKEDAGFDMVIRDIPGAGEVYIEFCGIGIASEDVGGMTIYMNEGEAEVSRINYQKQGATYSSGNDTYAANIGYADEKERVIHISFEDKAEISLDEINVYYLPLDSYAESVSKLTEESLRIAEWSDTEIVGTVSVEEKKILCVPLVYSKGWHVFVDGKKQPLYKVNLMYCGLVLDKGVHEVRFEYETPFLKMGLFLSLFGAVLFAGMLVYRNKREAEA